MLKLCPAKIDNALVKEIERGHQQFSFTPINGQLAAASGGGMEVVVCKKEHGEISCNHFLHCNKN